MQKFIEDMLQHFYGKPKRVFEAYLKRLHDSSTEQEHRFKKVSEYVIRLGEYIAGSEVCDQTDVTDYLHWGLTWLSKKSAASLEEVDVSANDNL